jgi:hypothetical protein
MRDDTDEIMCKVDRRVFEEIGAPMIKKGGEDDLLWAIYGNCPDHFRMIWVKKAKDLDVRMSDAGRRTKAIVSEEVS